MLTLRKWHLICDPSSPCQGRCGLFLVSVTDTFHKHCACCEAMMKTVGLSLTAVLCQSSLLHQNTAFGATRHLPSGGLHSWPGLPRWAWGSISGSRYRTGFVFLSLSLSLSYPQFSLCELLHYDTRWALYLSRFISVHLSPLLSRSLLFLSVLYIITFRPTGLRIPWHRGGGATPQEDQPCCCCAADDALTVTQWSRH